MNAILQVHQDFFQRKPFIHGFYKSNLTTVDQEPVIKGALTFGGQICRENTMLVRGWNPKIRNAGTELRYSEAVSSFTNWGTCRKKVVLL